MTQARARCAADVYRQGLVVHNGLMRFYGAPSIPDFVIEWESGTHVLQRSVLLEIMTSGKIYREDFRLRLGPTLVRGFARSEEGGPNFVG